MAYNQNMVGQNDKLNTNSDGITLYGDQSVVKLGYYNNFISIQMYPIKPPETRTPKSMYDYNNRMSCIISTEDSLYLAWVLNKVFVEKTNALEPCYTAIQTGKDTVFAISNGIKEAGQSPDPFIAIYKGFDEKKRAAERREFKFRTKLVITKYDPDTGECDAIDDLNYALYILAGFFEQAAQAICGGFAHYERHFERFRNNADVHLIRSIAGKLGISTENDGPVNYVTNATSSSWKSSGGVASSGNNLASSESNVGDIAALMSSTSLDELSGLE